MKKLFSLLAVLAVTVFIGGTAFTADTLPTTQKAYATFASEDLSVSFDLYAHIDGEEYTFTGDTGTINYPDTAKVPSIEFDLSNVKVGTTTVSFAKGTVFARVKSNLTKKTAGTNIYMFTTSTRTAAGEYQAKYNDDTHYSGLIRKGNKSTYAPGDNAPIEMHFVKKSEAPTTYPTSMSQDADAYGDKYLSDIAASDFADGSNALIGTSGVKGGIWIGNNTSWKDYSLDEDVIVFFGAKFDNVFAGDEYGTECINILTSAE